MDGSVGTAAGLIGKKSAFPDAVGQTLTMVDVVLTGYKVYAEAKSNSTTPYAKALGESISEHKLDLFNTSVGVAGTFLPEAMSPITAAVGLALFAYSQAYQTYITDGVDEWYKQYYPDEGEVYRRFYEDAGVTLYFRTEETEEKAWENFRYGLMDKPATMDDKKYKEFSKFVNNNKGIRTDSYKGFAKAFSKLIELYADEPEELEEVINDFFRSVAGAFWNMPVKESSGAAGTGPRYDFLKKYKYLGNDPFDLPGKDRVRISDSYVMKLKVDSIEVMNNVASRYQRKACETVMQKMEKEFLPVLK